MKKVLSFMFASMMLLAVSCSNQTSEADTQNDTPEMVDDSVSQDTVTADTVQENAE